MSTPTNTSSASAARSMNWAWLALTAITLGSWWLAPAQISGIALPSIPITAVVLALAFVKSRVIIQYFMEVRIAPRWLKRATDGWLVVLFGAIAVIYLI